MCLIPELMISREVARELYTRPRARNNLGNRGCTGESGFDPVELWVMGPPCGFIIIIFLIGAVTSFTVMIARHVREYHVSYVGNNAGTKGEGRREPFSCSLQRGGPIGKVLVHRWLPEVINSRNKVTPDRKVHRGVYLSRGLPLLG